MWAAGDTSSVFAKDPKGNIDARLIIFAYQRFINEGYENRFNQHTKSFKPTDVNFRFALLAGKT